MAEIHPTAIVSDGAVIGAGCSVGPYSCIGPAVTLGENCRVGPHVVIDGRTTLGRNNVVYQFASVGAAPQDLKWQGETTRLEIGDGNIIREYVTIQPGLEQFGGLTKIGSGNLFMACCHVAHDVTMGDGNWLTNSAALGGHVRVGSKVVFGGLSGAHQFCRIGDHAFVSAGSMVAQDVPPYCMVQGDRARLRSVNRTGLERAGLVPGEIRDIQRMFRMLFVSAKPLLDRIAEVRAAYPGSRHASRLLDFLQSTERGVVGYRRKRAA